MKLTLAFHVYQRSSILKFSERLYATLYWFSVDNISISHRFRDFLHQKFRWNDLDFPRSPIVNCFEHLVKTIYDCILVFWWHQLYFAPFSGISIRAESYQFRIRWTIIRMWRSTWEHSSCYGITKFSFPTPNYNSQLRGFHIDSYGRLTWCWRTKSLTTKLSSRR